MSTGNAPHHKGSYPKAAAAVRAWARANPDARCARCDKTLDQHPPTKTGRPPTWSAGHLIDGEIGGALAPEVLSCNARAGAKLKHQRARRTELTW